MVRSRNHCMKRKMLRAGFILLAGSIVMTGGCSQLFGGGGGSSSADDPSELASSDIWIMDGEDRGLYQSEGVRRLEDKLRIRSDGTAEIWGARGKWNEMSWIDNGDGTITFTNVIDSYSNLPPGSWNMAYEIVGQSALEARLFGTLQDGTPWEAERSYTAGTLTPPLTYEEDFEDGNARFQSGTEWEIVDDGGNKVFAPTNTNDGTSDATFNVLAGRDFVFKARFKLVEDNTNNEVPSLMLGFHHHRNGSDDQPSNRRPIIRLQDASSLIVDTEEDSAGNEYRFPVSELEWGTWHNIEVRVTDATEYQVLIDDTPVGRVTAGTDDQGEALPDTLTYVEGIKLEGNPNDEIWYIDDLSLEYPTTPTFAEDPLSDGEILYFERLDGNRRSMVAMQSDGTDVREIFTYDYSMFKASPVPGTRRIVFSAFVDAKYDIYSVLADGTDLTRLTDDVDDDWGAVVTPDGETVVFQSDRDGSGEWVHDIFTMDVDGSNQTNLTATPDAVEGQVEISPDGSKIAYAFRSQKTGVADELRVTNINDVTDAVPLVQTHALFSGSEENARLTRLTWNPDGSDIVFGVEADTFSGDTPSEHRLYRVSTSTTGEPHTTEGENLERLKTAAAAVLRDPTYSPDGTQILYHDASDMYIMDADGSNSTVIRDVPNSDGNRFTWNGMWVSIGSDGSFE